MTSPHHDAGKSSRRDVGVFDSNVTSSHFRSHHIASCHITSHRVTSRHNTSCRNITTSRRWMPTSRRCWKFMSNVATLDTNVATLLGFPTTKKLQKSNLWDFYTLLSCSFFILTILDHLMTIYFKNNTGSKPFQTKNLIFENFENMGTKN